jgi:hypothetical protein
LRSAVVCAVLSAASGGNQITIRVGRHSDRPEVMERCDESGIECTFGLPGDAVLACAVKEAAGVWLASGVAMRRFRTGRL